MVEGWEKENDVFKIIRWFWSLIKNLFRRKPKEIIPLKQDDKTVKQIKKQLKRRIRKLKRLSRKINRGKNKGKTQRKSK